MKIGSLCTGYGGLDMAAEAFFDAKTVWTSEFDKHASVVVEKRIQKPNLGDLTKIDWNTVEPIDILTAGYPCQPFSYAGHRKGSDDKRHIWPYILKGISVLRPQIVILENVRGHLTIGFREVLGDLAEIGYDAKWQVIRASDVGAPHQRARLFIVATDSNSDARQEPRRADTGLRAEASQILNGADRQVNRCSVKDVTNADDNGLQGIEPGRYEAPLSTAAITTINPSSQCGSHDGQLQELGLGSIARFDMSMQEVPNPLDKDGKLNAAFVEYMMGLPNGWVTDVGLSRSQQLKILGNGVVPQQAYYALKMICSNEAMRLSGLGRVR